MKKCSIITPVYESYEAVRRTILYYNKLPLPNNFEVIIIDDGSDEPIKGPTRRDNINIVRREDKRLWTSFFAINEIAKSLCSEYFFILSIDHFVSKKAIEFIGSIYVPKIEFLRKIAILDENGDIQNDENILKEYGHGLKEENVELFQDPAMDAFAIKSDIFWNYLGGYRTDMYVENLRASGADKYFHENFNNLNSTYKFGEIKIGPYIYSFPNPKLDIKKLFHGLPR